MYYAMPLQKGGLPGEARLCKPQANKLLKPISTLTGDTESMWVYR